MGKKPSPAADCCNPFNKPHSNTSGKQQFKKVSLISNALLEKCRNHLPELEITVASKLCAACRTRISREVERRIGASTSESSEEETAAQQGTEGGSVDKPGDGNQFQQPMHLELGSPAVEHPVILPVPVAEPQPSSSGTQVADPIIQDLPRGDAASVLRDKESSGSSGSTSSSSGHRRPLPGSSRDCGPDHGQGQLPTAPPLEDIEDPWDQPDEGGDPAPIDEDLLELPEFVIARRVATGRRVQVPSPTNTMLSSTHTAVSAVDSDIALEKANEQVRKLLKTPIKKADVRKPHKVAGKYLEAKSSLKGVLTGVAKHIIGTPKRACPHCKLLFTDLSIKFSQLKTKDEKYHCMTSVPGQYGSKLIQKGFGCTSYEATRAVALRREEGHFSAPKMRYSSRALSHDLASSVIDFFLHPDNSRTSPNRRDTILIRDVETNIKRPVAKQFIFVGLDELRKEYLRTHPEFNISRSKFAQLRPKQCVWPGRRGRHNMCVCEIHENFNLMTEVFEEQLSIEKLCDDVLCNPKTDDCFLGFCDNCPNMVHIDAYFEQLNSDEDVEYLQWESTDSTTLKKVTSHFEDFKATFMDYIPKIIRHQMITSKQKSYIANLRSEVLVMNADFVSVQVDFGQNYSFIVQNATQGWHWNNQQCTLHPFVVHFFNPLADAVEYRTYFALSDCLDHDANTFHCMRSMFMELFAVDAREMGLDIKRMFYVSDGAAGQYKNFKNYVNLLLHKMRYNIDAEWHFTATSHGKSTCDAMTAVLKRGARIHSLSGRRGNSILNAEDLYVYASNHLASPTLKFFYVPKAHIMAQLPALNEAYRNARTVPGTRSFHSVVPVPNSQGSNTKLQLRLVSNSEDFVLHTMGHVADPPINYFPESYVAVIIGSGWQIGIVQLFDNDAQELEIAFMKKVGRGNKFRWPDLHNVEYTPCSSVLATVEMPTTTDGTNFVLNAEDYALVRRKYASNP